MCAVKVANGASAVRRTDWLKCGARKKDKKTKQGTPCMPNANNQLQIAIQFKSHALFNRSRQSGAFAEANCLCSMCDVCRSAAASSGSSQKLLKFQALGHCKCILHASYCAILALLECCCCCLGKRSRCFWLASRAQPERSALIYHWPLLCSRTRCRQCRERGRVTGAFLVAPDAIDHGRPASPFGRRRRTCVCVYVQSISRRARVWHKVSAREKCTNSYAAIFLRASSAPLRVQCERQILSHLAKFS